MNNRDKIKDVCIDLFLKNGLDGTSTKMILNASRVSNGGLFHHFPTKNEIIKEIYLDIKEEVKIYLEYKLDFNKATRPFFKEFWTEVIKWGLQNERKKRFLNMYSKSAIIKNNTERVVNGKFLFIIDRIKKAINDKEIVSRDINYFFYHFNGSTDAIISYLYENKDMFNDAFLQEEFIQYWRSIVNF